MIIIIILNKFKNKMHKKMYEKKSSPVEVRTRNLWLTTLARYRFGHRAA